MARYFRGTGHILRFIEFMDVGASNGWRLDDVMPSAEVVRLLGSEFPIEPIDPNYVGEVAERWRYRDGAGEVGVPATGAHRGLPTSGPLSLTTEIPDGAEGVRKVAFTQQVVGTGTAYLAEPVDLVMLSRPDLVAGGGLSLIYL